VAKNKGDVVLGTEVSKPVPTKDAFHPHDNIIEIRKDQLKKGFGISFDILMHFGFSLLVQDADIHFSCVQIDTAIVFVLLDVKFHLGLLWVKGCGVIGNSTLTFHLREGHN
jgi:hypothetical protein